MSDEQDKSQKTEEPTLRRLEKAREEGQTPFSKDLNHFFMLLTLTLLVLFLLPRSFAQIGDILKPFLGASDSFPFKEKSLMSLARQLLAEVGMALALPTFFIMITAVLGTFAQTKFLVSLKNLKPKLSKFSPLKGLERLFGVSAWVEFFKNILKFSLITGISVAILSPEFDELESLLTFQIGEMLSYLGFLILKLLGVMTSLVVVIALFDVGYQKYQFLQNLKMSHQEIKDEYKETEGDPHVKQRLRQIRQEKSQRRVAQAVSDSSVVITNPTHYAIALKYEHGQTEAPLVVAKGIDHLALQIKKIAKENKVPVIENPPLARALHAGVKEGDEIPVDFYDAVAKIIRHILKLDQGKR